MCEKNGSYPLLTENPHHKRRGEKTQKGVKLPSKQSYRDQGKKSMVKIVRLKKRRNKTQMRKEHSIKTEIKVPDCKEEAT